MIAFCYLQFLHARTSSQILDRRLIRLAGFILSAVLCLSTLTLLSGCRTESEAQRVRPRQLRDVPAQRLAFTFAADVEPPQNATADEPKQVPAIQQDFDERRKDEELVLLRTLPSPDGQRALALYSKQDEPSTTFRRATQSAPCSVSISISPGSF